MGRNRKSKRAGGGGGGGGGGGANGGARQRAAEQEEDHEVESQQRQQQRQVHGSLQLAPSGDHGGAAAASAAATANTRTATTANGNGADAGPPRNSACQVVDDDSVDVFEHIQRGNAGFRGGDFALATREYGKALVLLVQQSAVLRSTTNSHLDPVDGVRVFQFETYGDDCDDVTEQQIIHRVALVLRNCGIALCTLENYRKAKLFLIDSCKFTTTGLEAKSYYWKSIALLKVGSYEEALDAIEQAVKLCSWGRHKLVSQRLHRKNSKMRHTRAFDVQVEHCRELYDEAARGLYDLEKLFEEIDPGADHLPFNLAGVQTQVLDESRRVGLVATRPFKEGELIFVSAPLVCTEASDVDTLFVRQTTSTCSAFYKPLHDIINDRKRMVRQQDLLRRFCQYLITKNGRDPEEDDILEGTCYHFAEGIGAIKDNGDIDHEKVAKELMKQEELCEELLGPVDGTKDSNAMKSLRKFCETNKCEREDIITDDHLTNAFVRFSAATPGTDPFGDVVVAKAARNNELLEALLRLPSRPLLPPLPFPADFDNEHKVRKLSLVNRQTGHNFDNGAEMLLAKEQCPVPVAPGFTERTALWLEPSFMGHSCVPNTKRLQFGHLCFVQAAANVTKGELLTCAYTTDHFRKPGELTRRWGLTCTCEFCRAGGAETTHDDLIEKWKEVFCQKVLPKFAPGAASAAALKHTTYAIKLLSKLKQLVTAHKDSLSGVPRPVTQQIFRSHFMELYYTFVDALEQRPEHELKLIALQLREARIKEDCLEQLGLLTLIGKRLMSLENNREKAKLLLPLETEVIRQHSFAHDSQNQELLSGSMKALLFMVDFPSSDLVSYVGATTPV